MEFKQPIGLLGGTFDPVHFGHLRIALEMLEDLALAEIRLIPCHQPPHRGQPGASSIQRLEMLQLALNEQPGFVIDQRELHRDGPSFTVDTLKSLRLELPQTPLCLVLGMDAFRELESWHHWRKLLDFAHLIVLRRPDADDRLSPVLSELVARRQLSEIAQLSAERAGGILFRSVTQLAISATSIRRKVGLGRSPRFLLPDVVYDYIQQHKLYQNLSET